MKTKDRIKEEIGLHKLLMTIASAMFSSLASWLFNNSDRDLSITVILLFLLTTILLVLIIFFFIKINVKIGELDHA
jgi:cell shape-determining protein MreD